MQNCDELRRVHRKIIKNLFKQHYPDLNYINLLKKLELLKPIEIYKFYALELYYKIKYCGYFTSMSNQFTEVQPSYNTRRQNVLHVPFPRTNCIMMNFLYQIPTLWNGIDNEIKQSSSLHVFKTKLKKRFIDQY